MFRSRTNSVEIQPVVCLLLCANYKLVDAEVFEISRLQCSMTVDDLDLNEKGHSRSNMKEVKVVPFRFLLYYI